MDNSIITKHFIVYLMFSVSLNLTNRIHYGYIYREREREREGFGGFIGITNAITNNQSYDDGVV